MESKNTKTEANIKNTLQYVAIFIGIFTPYSYLLGLTYYQGYMSAFGVEAESFPLAAADVYVNSYIAIGLMIMDIVMWAMSIFKSKFFYMALSILIIATYSLIKLRGKSFSNQAKYKKKLQEVLIKGFNFFHFKNNDLTKALAYVSVPAYVVMLFIYVLALISLFWWGLPYWASHKGKVTATSSIEKYLEKGCYNEPKTNWNVCVFVINKEGVVLHEGLLIAKNDKENAIFQKDGSYLLKSNDSSIVRRRLE